MQFTLSRCTGTDDTVSAALTLAARNGHEGVVNVLVEAGAEFSTWKKNRRCLLRLTKPWW